MTGFNRSPYRSSFKKKKVGSRLVLEDEYGNQMNSDYIGPSPYWAHEKGKITDREIGAMLLRARTIGGHMLWPVHKVPTINTARGGRNGFYDRIDLTPQEIRYMMTGEPSTKNQAVRDVIEKEKYWFSLFMAEPGVDAFKRFITTFKLCPFVFGEDCRVISLAKSDLPNGEYAPVSIDEPVFPAVFGREESSQVDEKTGERLFKNTDSNGRFLSDWCSMIYSRLLLARNLLAKDGVICISIDDNEYENLRKVSDEIFGEDNLVNIFIWNCSTAGGIRPKFASKTHEYIVCYARDINALPVLYAPLSEDAKKMYTQKDDKGLYRDKDFIFKNKSTNINQKYLIECPDGEKVRPKDGYIYRFIRERFDEALNEGLVTFKRTNTGPLVTENGEQAHWNIYIKKYLGDAMGAPSTLIPKEMISIYNVGTQCVQSLFDGVRVFENVKPVDVISYFINMMTGDGDIILDFFSGSATTAHSAMQINSDSEKKHKYIMIQIPQDTEENSDAAKAGYKNICEIGKERIRRAGKKIQRENPQATDLDIGFRVFKLDDSNMKDVYYSAGEYSQSMLAGLESNIKEDRTDLDLFFGCLLDWGLPLSLPYTSEEIDGCTVHTYNEGDLIACFDENIPDSVIKTIAKRQPLRAVFRDSSFEGSPSKINVGEIFKLLAPDTRIKVI